MPPDTKAQLPALKRADDAKYNAAERRLQSAGWTKGQLLRFVRRTWPQPQYQVKTLYFALLLSAIGSWSSQKFFDGSSIGLL